MNRVTCRHDYVEGEPGDYRCCDCGKPKALLRTVDNRYWHPKCVVEIRKRAGRVAAPPKQKKWNLQEGKQG